MYSFKFSNALDSNKCQFCSQHSCFVWCVNLCRLFGGVRGEKVWSVIYGTFYHADDVSSALVLSGLNSHPLPG